jgi:hypothetical protein
MPGILVRTELAKRGTIPNGSWITCVTNATSTASTATELLNPLSSTKTVSQVVKVGNEGRRGIFRARYETAISASGTSSVIRLFGIYATDAQLDAASLATSTTFPTDGTVKVKRLDSSTSTAAGITVALVPGASGDLRDSTYKYSNPITLNSSEFIDLCNCDAVLVLVETAAIVTNGTPIVEIEMLLVD